MKYFATFIFVAFSPIYIYTQQPMPLDKIVPKFDSILTDANILYSYLKSAETAEKIAFDSIQLQFKNSSTLAYEREDTLIHIVLDENSNCAIEMGFVGDFDSPIFYKKKVRELSELEDSLLRQKLNIITQVKEDDRIALLANGFYYEYIFIPKESGFELYVLNRTNQENIFPAGNNYILTFTSENMTIYRFRQFSHPRNSMKFDQNTAILILNYPIEIPLITAIDICKFNLYRHNLEQALWVHSQRNKRIFVYDPKSNEITVQ